MKGKRGKPLPSEKLHHKTTKNRDTSKERAERAEQARLEEAPVRYEGEIVPGQRWLFIGQLWEITTVSTRGTIVLRAPFRDWVCSDNELRKMGELQHEGDGTGGQDVAGGVRES